MAKKDFSGLTPARNTAGNTTEIFLTKDTAVQDHRSERIQLLIRKSIDDRLRQLVKQKKAAGIRTSKNEEVNKAIAAALKSPGLSGLEPGEPLKARMLLMITPGTKQSIMTACSRSDIKSLNEFVNIALLRYLETEEN